MGFDAAIKFLKDYRLERRLALDNQKRQPWSTEPLEDLNDFFSEIFDSKTENDRWEELYNQSQSGTTVDIRKLQGVQLKIGFLAGCRRDTGMMFLSWLSPRRLRMPLDHDRYEMSRVIYHNHKVQHMKNIFDTMERAGT